MNEINEKLIEEATKANKEIEQYNKYMENYKFHEPIDVIPADLNISSASRSCDIILECIKNFEGGLDDEHEVDIKLASFGQTLVISVTNIRYSNPDTLIFEGYVEGQDAVLIQNVSQLSFLLLAVKKHDPNAKPRRIGYDLST